MAVDRFISVRGIAPTNHQKLTQLNSGDYSSLIPIPPFKNAGTGYCVFSFQRGKFAQSASQVNILNR